MATYRYIAHDIAHDLKQLYDDAQVNLASIAYWMHIVGDYYKRIRIERYDAHQYLSTIRGVTPTVDADGTYITIPAVYDFQRDKGVDYVEIVVGGKILRCSWTTVSQLGRIRVSKEEAPSATNPVCYLDAHRLYLLPGNLTYTSCTLGLYTSFDTTKTIKLDDEFVFPQDTLPRLKADLLNMGRLVLAMPENAVNDGTSQPTQKASIPNQPVTAPADETQQQ